MSLTSLFPVEKKAIIQFKSGLLGHKFVISMPYVISKTYVLFNIIQILGIFGDAPIGVVVTQMLPSVPAIPTVSCL